MVHSPLCKVHKGWELLNEYTPLGTRLHAETTAY